MKIVLTSVVFIKGAKIIRLGECSNRKCKIENEK